MKPIGQTYLVQVSDRVDSVLVLPEASHPSSVEPTVVGRVIASGPDTTLRPGQRVLLLHLSGRPLNVEWLPERTRVVHETEILGVVEDG